jgi:hypothetical protein
MAPPHHSSEKKVRPSLPYHRNTANSKNEMKINKPNQPRGRGRPTEYSKKWIKKLLLLRSCGLTNHEIVQLFGAESDATDKAKYVRITIAILLHSLTNELQ